MVRLHGIIPPVVTLFDSEGQLDLEANGRLADHLIAEGVHGLFYLGTTGEAVHLTADERKQLAAWAVKHVAGRVPVLVGTGMPGTMETIALTEHARQVGVDAAVIVSPYFWVPSDRQLLAHYSAVAESVDLPLLIYNIPGCTGKSLPPALITELALKHRNIAGLKNSVDSLTHMRAVTIETKAARPDFVVFNGHDEMLPAAMILGADGAVPSTANMNPRLLVRLYEQMKAGKLDAVTESAHKLARLVKLYSIGAGTPATIKAALKLMGIVDNPTVRLPALPLDAEQHARLAQMMHDEGMLR